MKNVKKFGLLVGISIGIFGYILSVLIAFLLFNGRMDIYKLSYLIILPYVMMGGGTVIVYAMRLGIRIKIKNINSNNNIKIKKLPFISIIIPMRNKMDVVFKVIESIAKQPFPSDNIEIIVIDDGSTDESMTMLTKAVNTHREQIRNFKLIRNIKSLGRLNALKQGFRVSKGNIVLFLDADTILDVNINSLYDFVLKLQDKDTGGVLGNFEPICGKRLVCYLQKIMYIMGLNLGREVDAYLGRPLIILSGAFSAYKREVLESVLNNVESNTAEDFELTLLTARKGWMTTYSKRAKALTDAPFTWRDLYHQQLRWFVGGFSIILKYFKEIVKGLRDKENRVWRAYSRNMMLYIVEEYVLPILQFIGYISLLYSVLTLSYTSLIILASAFICSITTGTFTLALSLKTFDNSRYMAYTPIFVTLFIPFLALIKIIAIVSYTSKGRNSIRWKDVASHRIVSA